MEAQVGEICIPGDRLTDCEQCESGYGTYVRHGYVFAALTGRVEKERKRDDAKLPTVSVRPKRKAQSIPGIGSVVTCKITQLTSRFARCQIVAIANQALSDPLRGLIRKEDVRVADRDRVEMHKCFRPGDLAVAKVLSLGDSACYLLTTAEVELGVVVARSERGVNMLPLSNSEMQCPDTSARELRKVARPQPQHVSVLKQQA